jgi:hypothetical protein
MTLSYLRFCRMFTSGSSHPLSFGHPNYIYIKKTCSTHGRVRNAYTSVERIEVLYADGRIILVAARKEIRFDNMAWFQQATWSVSSTLQWAFVFRKRMAFLGKLSDHQLLKKDYFMDLVDTEQSKSHTTHIKIVIDGCNSIAFDWINKHTISL